jgi:hypothetical protein
VPFQSIKRAARAPLSSFIVVLLFHSACSFSSLQGMPAVDNLAVSNLAAPLPEPIINARGVGAANENHLFVDRTWDFAQMRKVFNTVLFAPGDQSAVMTARAAGLSVILGDDYKDEFFGGLDISQKVKEIVQQVRSNPGTISGIWLADRLNEKYSADKGLSYLAATGGVLHMALPGVPVFVDVSDWELTCGLPEQSSCLSPNLRIRYPDNTNRALTAFYESGYIDGFFIGNNLKNNNPSAQARAWQTARSLWPRPFKIVSRASQLSFPEPTFEGDAATASALKTAYMIIPCEQGADGVSLWAWRQSFKGAVRTFLNKDASSNLMWEAMIDGANALGLAPLATPVQAFNERTDRGRVPTAEDAETR